MCAPLLDPTLEGSPLVTVAAYSAAGMLKWETQKANRALKDYVAMGSGRSLSKLYRRYTESSPEKAQSPTQCLRTLKNWSSRYDWQARLARWDELEREGEEEVWRDRRRKIREGEWSQAQTLLDRVEQMLKFPLAQIDRVDKTDADGNPLVITIVKPVRWSQRDIARFMQVSSELARLAAEMEQRRQALDVTSGGASLAQNVIAIIEHGAPNGGTNGD